MNITRKSFITSIISIFLAKFSFAKSKTFEEELEVEVETVIKKHAHEENNESTHRFIEAEIDDWAHMHVMSGEIDAFNVICGFNEDDSSCYVKCVFKKHGSKKLKSTCTTVELVESNK